jgi:amino acid transporter
MARDRTMPEVLARVLPQRRTPYVAIIVMAALGTLFAVFGSYDRLTNVSSFGYLLFYALNAFGLLYARKRLPTRPAHAGLPLWIPLAFLLGTTAVLVTVVASGLREIVVALTVLAVGIPVHIGLRWWYWFSPTQETTAMR